MSGRPEGDDVGRWWAKQTSQLLFAGHKVSREDDVPDLEILIPRLAEHKHELDQLEEDWIRHTGRL